MEAFTTIEKHIHEEHPSRMAFARHLASKYPDRSIKGWEMMIIRYQTNSDTSYTYDEATDTYSTNIPSGTITLCGVDHRQLLADYTSNLPTRDICLKFDMPTAHFNHYRRIHGFTRSSIPLTDEQVLADEPEYILDEIVNSRRHTLQTQLTAKENKSLRKDALKWRNLEQHIITDLPQLQRAAATVPRLILPKSVSPYALVVCPTDFHWGKHGWADEGGQTYNFEEARLRLMQKTQSLISRLPASPEKVFVGAGSDWFHVDNDAGTTTRGTPQDMCASPAEILISGCKLAREHIDLLRQVAPVEIVMMAGNHDRHSTLALMMYLSAAYENAPDVKITITARNRRYIIYGDTLLGFTHGDGMNKKTSLAALMAVEAREQWGLTSHKVWFHGHLHHQRLTENDGCLVVQMPSLAGHDRWHSRAGYTTSTAGLAAYFIDSNEGYIGSLFAPVSHED